MAGAMEIRAVVNQVGAAMELHGHRPEPIVLTLVSVQQLGEFRQLLAESNPDMRYASIGQLAVLWAQKAFTNVTPGVAVSPRCWTYNASTEEYSC